MNIRPSLTGLRGRDGGKDHEAMIPLNKKYYRPSRQARCLAILDSLAADSGLSQFELSRRTHLSSAMVNQYLKELQDEEFITYERVNGKSYRYVLTPVGERLRRNLFADFSSETVQIYSALKSLILEKLAPLAEQGVRKLVLFGASETCEVVLTAIRDSDFDVVALLDNDADKHGTKMWGYVISPPSVLETLRPHAIVITSFGHQDEIHAQLVPFAGMHNLEIVCL
jgi:DNA-binding MarR family transcriptional regulator